ncbi:MAG: hypothetical protein J6J01_06805 [Oscillospiraceae bacterium]|nr:hypothetical protein [Oscillospiraceae bacterium]MBP3699170.1 hypothetical protein [Oscillospiraceae bacterium]MBQ2781771.1 hypothetical protein [Oscillospiraceae bacterium]
MEDMDSRLNALLSDPEAMGRIMALAQQLSGESAASSPPPSPEPPPSSQQEDDGFDPMLLLKFLPLLQELRQDNSSQSMQFLSAMRPFLKPERQPKVERAVKLAHLICVGKKFLTEGGLELV